jgi:glycosyltransferase involved in cell wall biosynthesis
MRILLTADPMIPVPPTGYGGIERIVDALLRQYRAAGHEVALLAHRDSHSPADRRFEWPAIPLDSPLSTLRHALALHQAARVFQPDVIHSFCRLAYLLSVLPTRQRVVMSYQRHTGGRQVATAARLGGRTLRFTGCSEFIAAMGRRAGGDWTAIPNFVELDKLDFVRSVPADAPLVFLSRLDDIKGPDLAIAMARAAGRRLILAGNRSIETAQRVFFDREIAPHLGRDGIEWIGEVDDAQKNALLGQAAGLLVPIRWDEPFGIVFAEALACGVPVISSPRGALPEIVRPGETGFLVDTVEQGAAAIHQLGSLNRRACREAVERRFTARQVAGEYLDLFAQLTRAATS